MLLKTRFGLVALLFCLFGKSELVASSSISFVITEPVTSSGGVYANGTDTLVRTLWRNKAYTMTSGVAHPPPSGPNRLITETWDDKDEEGNTLTGSYDIKVLTHKITYLWEGVVGNTTAKESPLQASTILKAAFVPFAIAAIPAPSSTPSVPKTRMYLAQGVREFGPSHQFLEGVDATPSSIQNATYPFYPAAEFPYQRGPDGFANTVVCADETKAFWGISYAYDLLPRFVHATNVKEIPGGGSQPGTLAHESFVFTYTDTPNDGHVYGSDLYLTQTCGVPGPVAFPYAFCRECTPCQTTAQGPSTWSNATHFISALDIRWHSLRQDGLYWVTENTGMAVQRSGNYLVVLHGKEIGYNSGGIPIAEGDLDIVTLINKNTGKTLPDIHLSQWDLTAPRGVAVAGNVIYIIAKRINGSSGWVVFPFEILGNSLVAHIEPKSGHSGGPWWTNTYEDPVAVGVSANGLTIVVANAGLKQQLVARDPNANQIWVHGDEGGYRGKPAVTDFKFDFGGVMSDIGGYLPGAAITFQDDGTFWLAEHGLCRILKFSIGTGTQNNLTKQNEIAYKPRNYDAGTIKGQPTRLMCQHLEYEIDYSKSLYEAGGWILKRNWRYFREDTSSAWGELPARFVYNGTGARVVDLFEKTGSAAAFDGRTYFFMRDQVLSTNGSSTSYHSLLELALDSNGNGGIQQVRLSNGSAINAVVPPNATCPTIDEYGGWTSSSPLPLGHRGFYKQQMSASQPSGIQTITAAEMHADLVLPDSLVNPVRRHVFVGDKLIFGSNYIGVGSTPVRGAHLAAVKAGLVQPGGTPQNALDWKSYYNHPDLNLYTLNLKQCYFYATGGQHDGFRHTLCLEANGMHIVSAYHGEFIGGKGPNFTGGQANQFMHFYANGLPIGQFGELPSQEQNGDAFPRPGRAGNSFSISFARVGNGEDPNGGSLYFYHGDESVYSAVHRWKIQNQGSVSVRSGLLEVGGSVSIP